MVYPPKKKKKKKKDDKILDWLREYRAEEYRRIMYEGSKRRDEEAVRAIRKWKKRAEEIEKQEKEGNDGKE